MASYVVGDLHGNVKAFMQAAQRASIDKEKDTLILLGDICDGWIFVAELVEELLQYKNLIKILGNHDFWFIQYLQYGDKDPLWVKQGGQATLDSYQKNDGLLNKHQSFWRLSSFLNYYIDFETKTVFTHGGFDTTKALTQQYSPTIFQWDRSLWGHCLDIETYEEAYPFACLYKKEGNHLGYKAIHKALKNKDIDIDNVLFNCFIGHSALGGHSIDDRLILPKTIKNVTNMDTGAGYMGNVSIMNLETKEVFTSDPPIFLYDIKDYSYRK